MIPALDRPYALSPEAVERFRRDGFVRLKEVFDCETIGEFGPEIVRLTLEAKNGVKPLAERSTYGKAFLQVTNLWLKSAVARELVFSRRLAGIAARLLEVDGVRLYHDQALIKEPGGGFTPAHADQFYWPLASDRSITAWIPLQPVPAEMGPVGYYAGSQRFEIGRDLPISDDSERRIAATMEREKFELVDDPFEVGEVSFHAGWTFHRAGPNETEDMRSVMTIIYMDRDMRLKVPANQMEEVDREAFCPGIRPGDVIDSPLNPLLFES